MAYREDGYQAQVARIMREQVCVMVSIAVDSGAVQAQMAERMGISGAAVSKMKQHGERLRGKEGAR